MHSKDRRGGEEPLIVGNQLSGQPVVMASCLLSPVSGNRVAIFKK